MSNKIRFYEDPEFLRRQTLYILVSLASIILTLFTPLFRLTAADNGFEIAITGSKIVPSGNVVQSVSQTLGATNYLLAAQTFLILTLAATFIYMVSLYRKRQMQIKALRLSLGVLFLTAIPVLLNAFQMQGALQASAKVKLLPDLGLIFFALPVVALLLAQMAIKADIKKLRKMDRFW